MDWQGEGLIIGIRKHGESAVIVEVMSPNRGRHLGLVRGGRSRKMAATLQPGNSVTINWRARLDEHLGLFAVELTKPRAANLIADKQALWSSQLLCAHLRLLPERDPHDKLYEFALMILDDDFTALERWQMLSLFELHLLDELGFGLDLASCAVSGAIEGLDYVSPRTGRAVTAAAGSEFIDRLLPLPSHFTRSKAASAEDVEEAFRLTGHFLAMHVWSVRQIDPPTVRDQIIASLQNRGHNAVN